MTWRSTDELMRRVRSAAARRGSSLNEYVSAVLDAATNPELEGTEAERLRERLAQVELLVQPRAARPSRPSEEAVTRARAAAGRGTPLSQLVSASR
jgi:hypothetical protein